MYEQPQQQQRALTPQEEQQRAAEEAAYYYAGDQWANQKQNDPSVQVRSALYDAIEAQHSDDNVLDTWISSRRTIITRASRIPGIDDKTFRRLSRRHKYIVARAHSEGKGKILRSMCENFDFELELLVSVAEKQMQGLSGIGSLIQHNVSQKQEIRMPQQQAPPTLFESVRGMLPGGRK